MELKQKILDCSCKTEKLNEVGEMASAGELFEVLNHFLQSNDPD